MSEDGTNPPLFSDAADASDAPLPVVQLARLSAGAQLAQLRQARGWTVAEVADQLNLAPRQVQAIEADNHAALPGLAVTRGFIRAYAKVLKIDPAAMLAEMVVTPPAASATAPSRRTMPQTHYSDNRLNSVTTNKTGARWYAALICLVLLLVAGAVAQRRGWLPQDLDSAIAKLTAGLASSRGNGTGTGVDSNTAVVPPAASLTLPVSDVAPAVAPVLPAQVQAPSASLQAQRPSADKGSLAGAPAAGVAANANNVLVLTFRADSWVEIKGHGKNTVASKLYRAGTVETFNVSEPVQLLVGNAAGVDATLRGAPLALPSTSKNNVARLSLK